MMDSDPGTQGVSHEEDDDEGALWKVRAPKNMATTAKTSFVNISKASFMSGTVDFQGNGACGLCPFLTKPKKKKRLTTSFSFFVAVVVAFSLFDGRNHPTLIGV